MFCPNCGTRNDDAAAFCLNCGSSLAEETVIDSIEQVEETVDPSTTPIAQSTPVAPVAPVALVAPVVAPVAPTEASPVYATPVPVQYKPKKPLSKQMIGIIAGAAIIIIAVIVFIAVGKKSSDYEALATKYFIAAQAGKWDTVFDSIDIPNGEFLTKEFLIKAQSKTTPIEISNYAVNKKSDIYASIITGDKTLSDEAISKDVYIDYRIKGESSNRTDTIGVIKLKEKNLLFFDKYKISPDDIVKSDFSITVTKGAIVTIDGIEVSSKYLKDDSSKTTSSYSVAKDTYVIDYLFEGNYTIKVTQENMEDNESEVTVANDDDSYSYTSPKIASKVNAQLATAGQDALKTIYDAVVVRKDFSTLSSLFVNDSKIQSDAKSTYTYFMDGQITTAGVGLTKISLTSVTGTASQSSSGSDGMTAVTVTVKGSYSASLKSSYSTTLTDRTGTLTCYFYYRYQNGAWSLYDMDLARIY